MNQHQWDPITVAAAGCHRDSSCWIDSHDATAPLPRKKVRSAHRPRPYATQSPGSSARAGRCPSQPSVSRRRQAVSTSVSTRRSAASTTPNPAESSTADRTALPLPPPATRAPLGDEQRDRLAVCDRQHAPVPRRTERLQRALELEPGRPDHRPQPDVEHTPRRLTRQQYPLAGKRSDRNCAPVCVFVRRRKRRQKRLVPQRIEANAMAAHRRWGLLHDRRSELARRIRRRSSGVTSSSMRTRSSGCRPCSSPAIRVASERLNGPCPMPRTSASGCAERRASAMARSISASALLERSSKMDPAGSTRPAASFGRTAPAQAHAPSHESHATAATATYATAPPPARNATPPPPPRNSEADASQPKHPRNQIVTLTRPWM